jgi:hypothetical protein
VGLVVHQGDAVALTGQLEAIGQDEIAVQLAGDFHACGHFLSQGQAWGRLGGRTVHAGGEQAGFEATCAEDGLLAHGPALEGEQFLRVDGLVGGDEVSAEVGDFLDVLEADDGAVGRGEAMLAEVLGRGGLACVTVGPVERAALARLAPAAFRKWVLGA